MRIAPSSEPASWILERLHPFGRDVGSIVPDGFPAYARILHPAYTDFSHSSAPVRWRDIAAANNRSIAEEIQLIGLPAHPSRLSHSGELLWNTPPIHGSIPRDIAARLAAILRQHTRVANSCWFAVWEGWSDDLNFPRTGTPVVEIAERNMFLLDGPIDDVLASLAIDPVPFRSANMWWPDDRTWCVATGIELPWTYVGGTMACIAQVLADPDLEVLHTSPAQGNLMEK